MKNSLIKLLIIDILKSLDFPFEEAPKFFRDLADCFEKFEEEE